MSIYASDPEKRPDVDFEPGQLRHLVVGAQGRLLDPRRTPVSVVEVRPSVGFVDIRVEGFEDAGAIWAIPLEQHHHYQFELGGPRASDAAVAEMQAAIERLAHSRRTDADPEARARTEDRIAARQIEAHAWLDKHSRFLAGGRGLPDPSSRRGDPLLTADLEAYLREDDLWTIEDELTRSFVSNPGAGERVKGHRLVLAELGLTSYAGAVVRDRATFEGTWSRQCRAEHIVSRLAFLRALFERLGIRAVAVWRGASIEGRLQPRPGRTFVSATFDEAVARDHFEGGEPEWTHVLVRAEVPVERLFMTYLETAAMNTVFLEAEAVVLDHPDDRWP